MKFSRFSINELERDNGRAKYWHYMRRFLTIYGKDEKTLFAGHTEFIVKKKNADILSIRFHIGNAGSETPWDGHFLLFGVGFFWGHSAFRKLATRLSRCKAAKYDSRDWVLRVNDGRLWWSIAEHDDYCDRARILANSRYGKVKGARKRHANTWRRGSINLSIPEAIWGAKRYSYVSVDSIAAMIKMPEGSYGVILDLQKVYFGRVKVARKKHLQSWTIDVNAPKGIPTHYDKSGGWKGDRTYGFGVDFAYPKAQGWQQDAENAVTAWCFAQRAKTGFREAQVEENA